MSISAVSAPRVSPDVASRIERFTVELEKKAPVLAVVLSPISLGLMAATSDDFLGKTTFREKWGPIGGGLATIGARTAIGIGAGAIGALVMCGGLVELGIERLRGNDQLSKSQQ